ncbi:MAG: 2-succinyl-5-enolpyruvyl-6-hydroxy-3-cyclohexene-1-carboxylic-acid synthase [Acidimicrobiales bacterium]
MTSDQDPPRPEDVQATFCATLVDEWVRAGVRHAVVAPGSRSTPMALALAADDRLRLHVHLDERSAAFVALGIGKATRAPAVALTTSGTAAVELHPAVVEADLAGVPLLAVTADRPPELQHVGAPQTVDQAHLFGRSVRWFVDPGVADAAAAHTWRSLGARAVAEATTGPAGPGPVQLNLPFREPLVGKPGPLPAGRPDGAPWHTTEGRRLAVDRWGTERLAGLLDADRGVIVAGAGAGDPEVVHALSDATGWPVLADPLSGCRAPSAGTVGAFDAILRHDPTAAALVPDVVLRLGEPPASKVLARWLAGSGAVQVVVHASGRWYDADRTASHVLHASPTAVAQALLRLVGARGAGAAAWRARWAGAEAAAAGAIAASIAAEPSCTGPGIAASVASAAPEGATLVVSSSMPVRDLEWHATPRTGLRVLSNRGANGIDGVVSTATGVALAAADASPTDASPTIALLGDLALLHDAGALVGAARRGIDLVLVVVDNDGGAIFSFLPQAAALSPERFELLFGTPQGVDLAALAAAHGIGVVEVASPDAVGPAVVEACAAGGVHLVRARTERTGVVAVQDRVVAAVAAALEALAPG